MNVMIEVGGLTWAQVVAGDARVGEAVKAAKEQLRALPDGVNYGVLRYLNDAVDLDVADPPIAFNYLGRQGAASGRADGCWSIRQDGWAVTDVAVAVAWGT